MSDTGTKLDIDSVTSIVVLITLLILLSLPISVSFSLPQKVTSKKNNLVVASKNKQFALDALKNAVNDVQ